MFTSPQSNTNRDNLIAKQYIVPIIQIKPELEWDLSNLLAGGCAPDKDHAQYLLRTPI